MFRQLDQRYRDGVTVTLEWDPATECVQVRCEDHCSPEESFEYAVNPRDARVAFLHPFALRPSRQDGERAPGSPDQEQVGTARRRRWFRHRTEPERSGELGDRAWMWWLE